MTFDKNKKIGKHVRTLDCPGHNFQPFSTRSNILFVTQKKLYILYIKKIHQRVDFISCHVFYVSSCIPLYKHESYISAASYMLIIRAWHIKENPVNMPTLLSLVLY